MCSLKHRLAVVIPLPLTTNHPGHLQRTEGFHGAFHGGVLRAELGAFEEGVLGEVAVGGLGGAGGGGGGVVVFPYDRGLFLLVTESGGSVNGVAFFAVEQIGGGGGQVDTGGEQQREFQGPSTTLTPVTI